MAFTSYYEVFTPMHICTTASLLVCAFAYPFCSRFRPATSDDRVCHLYIYIFVGPDFSGVVSLVGVLFRFLSLLIRFADVFATTCSS